MQKRLVPCILITVKRLKSKLITVLVIITVLLFSAFGKTVSASVSTSLLLCARAVIPTLFPFFALCEILTKFMALCSKRTAAVAYVNGLFSGFPSGINNVAMLYSNGLLDRKTADVLLTCCANASPAYVISFIGSAILGNRKAGFSLFIAQCAVSLFIAIIFGVFKSTETNRTKPIAFVPTVCSAVSNAVTNTMNVCGYIIFFGVLADVLNDCGVIGFVSRAIPTKESEAIITGIIEITKGLQKTDSIITAGILVGFSGISVILQCASCAYKAGLSAKNIVIGKFIYAALIPPLSFLIYTLICKNSPIFVVVILLVLFSVLKVIHLIFDKSVNRLYNKKKKTETANDFFKRHRTYVSVLRTR